MRDKWQACDKVDGIEFYLGTYRTPEEAPWWRTPGSWRTFPGTPGRNTTCGKADNVPVPDHAQGELFYIFDHAGAATDGV